MVGGVGGWWTEGTIQSMIEAILDIALAAGKHCTKAGISELCSSYLLFYVLRF